MERYDDPSSIIRDLTSDLNTLGARTHWETDSHGNKHLHITCNQCCMSQEFTDVVEHLTEVTSRYDMEVSVDFDRTFFGVPTNVLLETLRRSRELPKLPSVSSHTVQLPRPLVSAPVIDTQWTPTPSYTPSYSYPAPRGFDWEWLQDCVVYFLIVVGTLALSWFMWVTHGFTQF